MSSQFILNNSMGINTNRCHCLFCTKAGNVFTNANTELADVTKAFVLAGSILLLR